MKDLMMRLITEEEGQGMVEYGLIIALVAVAVITALTAMGGGVSDIFDKIKGSLGVEG
ncbi:MAG TPA: Flp family type IVb pilin [Clostridia bacterium]|nr:Flp family type IVb pilin [Clostridia bacterium]